MALHNIPQIKYVTLTHKKKSPATANLETIKQMASDFQTEITNIDLT